MIHTAQIPVDTSTTKDFLPNPSHLKPSVNLGPPATREIDPTSSPPTRPRPARRKPTSGGICFVLGVPDQQARTVFYGCAYTTDDVIPSLHEAAAILRAGSGTKGEDAGFRCKLVCGAGHVAACSGMELGEGGGGAARNTSVRNYELF
ncbi:hypothetical protein Bbelb_321390 [Branchiostoma belcheri]|nr:hypothetical protein Bbelb_321390 [Branchiostoma belcheri]